MSMLLLLDDIPLSALVLAMFANNEQGAWYDPSDFSTLFQDSAGTTPVTALGQGVGLMLDKRLGLVLGPELLTNGDFSSGATGWTVVNADATHIATFSGGTLRYQSDTTSPVLNVNQVCVTAGKWYEVTAVCSSYISGSIKCDGANGTMILADGVGTKRVKYLATSTTFTITRNSANVDVTLDSISVRELLGNHAYQSTPASRPAVQSPYISFDKTDDHLLVAAGGAGTTGILLAVGIMVPAAGTARTIWSDRGTNTGYRLSIDATNKVTFSGGTGAGHTTLTSAGALTAGTKYILMAWHDGTNLNLSINNVAETPVALGTVTAGTSSFTVGKDNGAASGYWGDRLYQMVYRKNDASNATQRNNVFAYIRQMMQGL